MEARAVSAAQIANTSQSGHPFSSVNPEWDPLVLRSAEDYLDRGVALLRWWSEIERKGGPDRKFPLARSFNPANRSYGFFGRAPLRGGMTPVMGNVQEMFFDQPRAPASLGRDTAEWMWEQLRVFVLRYFMRVSSFKEPEAYSDARQPVPPPALKALSWCAQPQDSRQGFGFSQLCGKRTGSGDIYQFPSYERNAIVDLREVGRTYEWLLLKVRIFDFRVRARPFGEEGPELVFGLDEGSYLALNDQFVINRDRPEPGVLGEYGVGYAFIKNPLQGLIAYGPGEFDAAFESIRFRILDSGRITVRMVFVANLPTAVANVVIDPVEWSFRVADLFSFGMASRLFGPLRVILGRLPLQLRFDPVLSYVAAANSLSGDAAARQLCISREQLDKLFLLQHFRQHYQTIIGALLTWRQVPNWLDEKNLPPWAISGRSA
jgi:hypothetical protein